MMALEWWQKKVIYHIYLPSFKDSNDDGIGDIPGLISELHYFKELGVSSLLLSPFYPSPMKDNGYDITNFTEVDPKFGTMKDFDHLLFAMKQRDLNLLIDFVANHTSDQHPWFLKSIERECPYNDFYVWADGKPGLTEGELQPPNNWLSVFGGSAWTWNGTRKQFYYHQFLPEQPDLNYRNSNVRHEMKHILQFWIEKGVDGFRIDAASHLFEDRRLLDEPLAEESTAKEDEYAFLNHIYTKGLKDNLEVIQEWRYVLDYYSKKFRKPKIMLIEGMEDVNDVLQFYGGLGGKRLAEIPMNFQLYKVTKTSTGTDLQQIIDAWLGNMPLGKYPNYVLSSHDFPRIVSRVGRALASSLHIVMMLLPGIPICYYGDELGMENGTIAPEEIRDSFALRTKPSNSRDPMRTPMCWNAEKHAGFTEFDKPWLPVNPNYKLVNVEVERRSPFSFLKNFKNLVQLRHEHAILFGTFKYLMVNDDIFSFVRLMIGTKCYLIVVNMNSEAVTVDFSNQSVPLPPVGYLEVTNPDYYGRTRAKYGQSMRRYDIGAAQSTSAAEHFVSPDPYEDLMVVPLNDVSLEAKQCLVLSFEGRV